VQQIQALRPARRRDRGRARGVRNAILDGEVVCLDHDGRPLFNPLLYRRSEPCFVAFDCLWLDGRDLRRLPLIERKRVLRRIVPRHRPCLQCLPMSIGAAWTSLPRSSSGTLRASSPSSETPPTTSWTAGRRG